MRPKQPHSSEPPQHTTGQAWTLEELLAEAETE